VTSSDDIELGQCPVCNEMGVISQTTAEKYIGKPVRERFESACVDHDQEILTFHDRSLPETNQGGQADE